MSIFGPVLQNAKTGEWVDVIPGQSHSWHEIRWDAERMCWVGVRVITPKGFEGDAVTEKDPA
jgi:hypothetical protein